jgi:hypothetical protein
VITLPEVGYAKLEAGKANVLEAIRLGVSGRLMRRGAKGVEVSKTLEVKMCTSVV